MACDICEHIANEIDCESCADEIITDCEEGRCDGEKWLKNGSVNGHPISPLKN